MSELALGMIGLGVMGRNLALNIEEKGFSVAAYDAWPEPVDRFVAEVRGKRIEGFHDLASFARAIERPRRIVMLVKAGEVVDKTIAALRPHLEPGDVLVDGGNEYFANTERRTKELATAGIHYFGMGISGGEVGARRGPSLMPGGDKDGYEALAPVLMKVAAQHPDGPCVTYVGLGGSGHYVKMVHNGIEYGDMQLIAEAYDMLRVRGGLSNEEIADVFDEWNQGELESYLVEITAKIFRFKDPEGEGYLVDKILDATAQKGTGRWTVEEAAELGVAIPTIGSAVEAREISIEKAARVLASRLLPGPPTVSAPLTGEAKKRLIADMRAALYASKACSYAQGLHLLGVASSTHGWGLRLGELARIWQAGCIIRAKFLGRIKEAYEREGDLQNLLFDASFRQELESRQPGFRRVVSDAALHGVPLLSTSSSLGYYDMSRRERLPANLTQAQRDFFGSHTYKRVDREGDFHTDWSASS
jgi:6-phosphogluconate dehydrogenase